VTDATTWETVIVFVRVAVDVRVVVEEEVSAIARRGSRSAVERTEMRILNSREVYCVQNWKGRGMYVTEVRSRD